MFRFRSFTLYLIPVLTLVFSLLYLHKVSAFYFSQIDPVYAYLVNAYNIILGIFSNGIEEHPGITVMYLLCAVIYLVSWINGTEYHTLPLEDPESVLYFTMVLLIVLTAVSTLLLGKSEWNKSGSLCSALFLQISPIWFFPGFIYALKVSPEPFLVICTLASMVVLIKGEKNGEFSMGDITLVSFFMALGTLSKFTFLPLIILPIVMINTYRKKIEFMVIFIAFVAACSAPFWTEISETFAFVGKMTTHKGLYGKGDVSFMDLSDMWQNLIQLSTHNPAFSIGFVILTILILAHVHNFRNPTSNQKILLTTWLVSILFLIAVSKHYKSYYILPATLLMPYGILRGIQGLQIVGMRKKILATWGLLIITSVLFIKEIKDLGLMHPENNPYKEFAENKNGYNHHPWLIISNNCYGSPFPEHALMFGWLFSGHDKGLTAPMFVRMFDDVYFMEEGKDVFNWKGDFHLQELLSKHDTLMIYSSSKGLSLYNHLISNWEKENVGEIVFNRSSLKGQENISMFIPKDSHSKFTETTMFRSISADKNQVGIVSQSLDSSMVVNVLSPELQTNEQSFSGSESVKITNETRYGMVHTIPVFENAVYEISVWQKREGGYGIIMLESVGNKDYYKVSKNAVEKSGEWEKLSLRAIIPKNLTFDTFNVAVRNDQQGAVFMDDMEVKIVQLTRSD